MSVNGKTCWTKTGWGTTGKQMCGAMTAIALDESFRVTGCSVTLSGSGASPNIPLTVRAWTSLDQSPDDESFGIANVVIEQLEEGDSGRIYARE